MIYPVYRGSEVIFNLDAESGSTQETVLNGIDICRLRFVMPNVVDIQIKDYILVDGKKYSFNTIPDFTKTSERKYTYDCTVESIQYELGKVLFQDGNGISDFFLTGDLVFFIAHLVSNLNRVGTGWTYGVVKDGTETLNLQFSNESCLAVLQRLCGQYLVNFKITDSKVISVDNFTQADIPVFSYGEGKGLYELTRTVVTSKNHITRLYAYGGDKNIPANYRDYSTRLKLPTGYIEKNVDKYDVIEGSQPFDEIYPRFKGTVTQVVDDFTYRCSAIDFDLNAQKMPGVNMKIRFNSGQLAGYEFELATYNHSTKEFKVNTNDQEKAVNNSGTLEQFKLPNTLIKAGLGDRFVFVDIIMPQTYIDNAEAELLVKANEYLDQNCDPRAQHDLKIDPLYIRNSGIVLNAGDYINIKDTYLNIDKNDLIVSRTKDLYKIGKIDIKLSDSVAPQTINRNVAALEDIKRVIIRNQLGDIYRTNRGLKSMDEAFKLYFDSDGYLDEDRIRPLSIQTGMISVGGKASQFSLSCVIEPTYQGNVAWCKLGAGTLVHFAIEETIRMWTMSESTRTDLVSGTAYYIYARCLRVGTTGALVIDTAQRKVDSDPTNYYFLVGVLNSVVDGMRLVSLMYGVTTIVGGQIKTGTISSPDGLTFFDVQNGIFQGVFKFKSGSEGIENVLQLGGRNLIRNSDFKSNLNYWFRGGNHDMFLDTTNTYQGHNSLRIVSTGVGNNTNRVYTQATTIISGKQHVVSFWAKALAPVQFESNNGNGLAFNITTSWAQYYYIVTSGSYQFIRFYLLAAGTVWMTMPQMDQSNILSEWRPAPEDVANELTETYSYVDAIKDDLQSQIDGQIISWYEHHDPTLANYPANQWTTVEIKNNHLGDEFYNLDSGAAWKFIITYGNYVWSPIEDVDIQAALDAAARAQDTADGKRRTFRVQPYAPYDPGDSWYQGAGGDILVCSVGKPEGGIFSQSDWVIASKYTNDALAAQAIIDAANAAAAANTAANLANSALTLAGQKTQNFTSQPVPPYRVNDTWQDGTYLRTCVVTRLTGSYVSGDWAIRVTYDNTETIINGGLLTTGRLGLKDSNGVEWAGMRGATGVDGTEVAAWFGASFVNRNSAPTRFYHNGEAFMGGWTIKKDSLTGNFVFLKDTGVNATSAGMSPTDYVFFAGATYANRANAKYWVKPDGEVRMTKAALYTGTTGKRIEIRSDDNTLTLYSDNNNFIKLDADTTGLFDVKLSVGNATTYRTELRGYKLEVVTYSPSFKYFNADTFNQDRPWTRVQIHPCPYHWQVQPLEPGADWQVLYVNKNTGTLACSDS